MANTSNNLNLRIFSLLFIKYNNKEKILKFFSIPNHLFTFTHKKSVNIFHFISYYPKHPALNTL